MLMSVSELYSRHHLLFQKFLWHSLTPVSVSSLGSMVSLSHQSWTFILASRTHWAACSSSQPVRKWLWWTECLCPPPSHNFCIEALTHSVTAFGNGAFGRKLWLDEFMKMGPHDRISVLTRKRRETRAPSLYHVRTQSECKCLQTRMRILTNNPTMIVLWSWTSSLQNWENIRSCCLNYPVYGMLLEQPGLTKTLTFCPNLCWPDDWVT